MRKEVRDVIAKIKKQAYKVLCIFMIYVAMSFFMVQSVSHAKLKLQEGQKYYSGTQEAEYVVEKGPFDDVLNFLGEIANYILGIISLGIRAIIIGWVEIFEIILTIILGLGDDIGTLANNVMTSYTQNVVTIEKIFFNEVPILDANIFKTSQLKADDLIIGGGSLV